MSWPSEESDIASKTDVCQKPQSIMDYLSEKAIGLAINLPMRSGGCSGSGSSARRTSSLSVRTRGYKFRRLAIEMQVPLITDVKCAKLFVQVGTEAYLLLHIFLVVGSRVGVADLAHAGH